MKICPLMSMRITFNAENSRGDRIPGVWEGHIQNCLEKECALWVIEQGESKIPIERCGLIK